jgi:RNA polymerase sigma-70 factor (ECF subfamily)
MYKLEKRDREFDQRLAKISDEISKEDPLLFKELEKTIQKIFSELPPDQQAIFKFSREHKMKYQEIADHLDISVKTVEKKISKSLSQLRLGLNDALTLALIFSILS